MSARRVLFVGLMVVTPLLVFALAIASMLVLRQGGLAPYRVPSAPGTVIESTPVLLAQGEYVARLGNCVTCHSTRGGVPFTGGLPFVTEWGTLYSSNLTPDPRTGLGGWSVEEFRHTMRNGVSRHGVLYPAFPYANFALMSDADLDALFVYLQNLPATAREPTPNRLEFPASWRTALIGWRMLHYRPQNPDFGSGQPAQWQRGRYLVDGLGHCAMCHGTRGSMGSLPPQGYLAGGSIPGLGWYAPPLDQVRLQRYSATELADYLRNGTSPHGAAYGPMAEVVYTSLRYLTADDATAIAVFLKSVPSRGTSAAPRRIAAVATTDQGAGIYHRYCEDCHGADGRGKDLEYPPLAGSVAVTAADPVNAVRLILYGAIPPTTAGNPRPHSMPPYVQQLSAAEVAAVTNYIRTTWGKGPSYLTGEDVDALHGIVID